MFRRQPVSKNVPTQTFADQQVAVIEARIHSMPAELIYEEYRQEKRKYTYFQLVMLWWGRTKGIPVYFQVLSQAYNAADAYENQIW